MLINLSNHPSQNWQEKQSVEAGRLYGEIIDIPFPVIDPNFNETEIENLAKEYFSKIKKIFAENNTQNQNNAVHIMGELTFCFTLITLLNSNNISTIASTTNRNVVNEENGQKTVVFDFVKFRIYI